MTVDTGPKLVALARALQAVRPDLTHADRADLAIEIVKANGCTIDRAGTAYFVDNARKIEPKLPVPHAGNPTRQKVHRAMAREDEAKRVLSERGTPYNSTAENP